MAYRNVFRGSLAANLQVSKKHDIMDIKAHNKQAQAMTDNADVENMKRSDLESAQHIRNRASRVGVTKKV